MRISPVTAHDGRIGECSDQAIGQRSVPNDYVSFTDISREGPMDVEPEMELDLYSPPLPVKEKFDEQPLSQRWDVMHEMSVLVMSY